MKDLRNDPQAISQVPATKVYQKEKEMAKTPMLSHFKDLVGNDLVMIYGPTRAGKSSLAREIAKEVLKNGGKVFYLDTEGSLDLMDRKELGQSYRYTPLFEEIENIVRRLPELDVFILDSVGLPILGKYARANFKQRGEAMLSMHALLADIKDWAHKKQAIAIVINQDKSTISREETESGEEILEPFGGKGAYFVKEILRLIPVRRDRNITRSLLLAHDCRKLGRGAPVAEISITADRFDFSWKLKEREAPIGIPESSFKDFEILINEASTDADLDKVKNQIPWDSLSPEQKKTLSDLGKEKRRQIREGKTKEAPF
ncbi:MAG: AAA family ATPase [Actinomycetota bacterium]